MFGRVAENARLHVCACVDHLPVCPQPSISIHNNPQLQLPAGSCGPYQLASTLTAPGNEEMTSLNLSVGQKVQLNDGRSALVRFKGATSFAPGEWIGVELEDSTGKNDGAVQGERYFDCEDKHGMFLRATGIGKVLEQPASKRKSMGPPATKPRPSSVGLGSKSAVTNGRTRESLASPTPAARGPNSRLSGIRSPIASPTKQLSSANSSSSSRTSTPSLSRGPPSATVKSRSSLAPSSTATRRTATLPAQSPAKASTRTSPAGTGTRVAITPRASNVSRETPSVASRLSVASQVTTSSRASAEERDNVHRSETSSEISRDDEGTAIEHGAGNVRTDTPDDASQADRASQDEDVDATPKPDRKAPPTQSVSSRSSLIQSITSPVMSSASTRAPVSSRAAANQSREIEDLKTKLRLLEKRRVEDREKLKALERIQQERDRFESIIQKLQQKYQPQQQELADLKKQIKESEFRFASIESIQADHDAELENATLDREMAEEQYEAVRTELAALREKYEEMELEVEVLREENQELSQEMSPEERTSQGWLQLERSNERYREALIRLRDITQEQEAELKQQITALEKDLEQFSGVNDETESLKVKLLESEAAIEDLKQQLELAQGSDEMLEELSERNLNLQERIDDLNIAIEDLENLKELNDELEVNHVEAEKQMQEEIDFKDSVINEQLRRSQEQQKSIEDYEMTVARFREAFRNLQADLEDMRASKQITDTEAEDLSSKSRALMDLNMKLQSSAAKTQIKSLDLELQRLEAEEAAQHLSIVRLFLPESYQADRDSVLALLRIKRIGFKSRLIQDYIRESIDGGRGDNLFAGCRVIGRLAWIVCMCRRLTNAITECSATDFAKFEGSLYELESIERALNGYIEFVKREDVSLKKMDQELERSVAVMNHLGSTLLGDAPSAVMDDMIMAMHMMQSHLENTASALMLLRTYVESHSRPTMKVNGQISEDDEEEDNQAEQESNFGPFYDRIDSLVSQSRGAKVLASKANRELTDLRTRSLGIEASHVQAFHSAQTTASQILNFAADVGDKLSSLSDSTTDSKQLTPRQVAAILTSTSTKVFSLPQSETIPFSTLHSQLTTLTSALSALLSLATDLSQTVEFTVPSPPWEQRSQTLKSASLASFNNEVEVTRLNEMLKERNLLVRTRERELDDQSVRIEMLEARMKDASRRTARIEELEAALEAAHASEKQCKTDLEKLAKDVSRLRKERDELRTRLADRPTQQGVPTDADASAIGAAGRLELQRKELQVAALRGTVRKLHQRPVRQPEDLDWLSTPLVPPRSDRDATPVREVKAVLMDLVRLTVAAGQVDLSPPEKGDRLAWRPARSTAQWIVAKQAEDWEKWRDEAARAVFSVERKKT
ncbi:hypothetical protein ANO11243_023830 [Dothideomycetidae sp. 11243]|nr:hypothetical protein ANO11243_023830 [fungal sp. No.11243]